MRTQKAIEVFLSSRIAANLSPITIDWYRDKLERFARSCPELPEQPEPVEAFLASVKGSSETKHAHFRALKALYRFIHERFDAPNPIAKVAPPRRPKKVMPTLEPSEAMRLLNSASDLRARAILSLLVDSGLRSSEVASLRKQDIQTETLTVRGKCGQRQVPISEETRRLLLAFMARDGRDQHVFLGHKGPLTRHGIYYIVRSHMEKAGIEGPKLGGHRIRHAFGKGYLENGGDIRSLQEIMGHASITTTQKYTALNLNNIIAQHHRFTPLRAAHAAAQESFFDSQAVREAEEILAKKEK